MFADSGFDIYLIVDKSELIGNDENKNYCPRTIPIIASFIQCNPYSAKNSLSQNITYLKNIKLATCYENGFQKARG